MLVSTAVKIFPALIHRMRRTHNLRPMRASSQLRPICASRLKTSYGWHRLRVMADGELMPPALLSPKLGCLAVEPDAIYHFCREPET